jgi:replicative DNA helicase
MGSLKGSGDIGDNADVVICVYRPGLYNSDIDLTTAEIIVDKNKDGPTGRIMAKFVADQMRFEIANNSDEFTDDIPSDGRNA